MPSFGMFTAEGRLTSWLVPPGTHVEAGQPVLEIETDKAVQEVIAPASGILHVVAMAGASVKEEQLLGYVLAEGEAPPPPEEHREADGPQRAEPRKPSPDSPCSPDEAPSGAPSAPSGAASGAASGVALGAASSRVVATPEARRLAAEHGIDLSRVTGTGPRGRVVAADVAADVAAGASSPAANPAAALSTRELARRIRRHIVLMTSRANASHVGSCLSMTDMLAVLYGRVLRLDAAQPAWPDRDRFILSKGHGCAALYAVLAECGFFPAEWLETYYADGTRLPGHATHKHTPGVELSTGSLGHGFPVGCGMALAAKRDGKAHRVFALISDGECDEGSTWEAALFAPHHKLDNLVVLVDFNKIQSLGTVKEVMDLDPLAEKWRAFGWATRELDGHDLTALEDALTRIPFEPGRPSCIVAHTVKGKGVSFMEHNLQFHYTPPRGDEVQRALAELEERG